MSEAQGIKVLGVRSNDLFLCRNCGQYKTRGGRFPLKDHFCEECQSKIK